MTRHCVETPLTIRFVADLKGRLEKDLADLRGDLELDMQKATQIDGAGYQLLRALAIFVASREGTLRLVHASDSVSARLRLAGGAAFL